MFPLDPLNPPRHVVIDGLPTYPPYRMQPAETDCETMTEEATLTMYKTEIYPNPTRDYVHISSSARVSFTITDVAGRRIQSFPLRYYDDYSLSLTHYAKGVYFINFFDADGLPHLSEKVIKL